MSHSSDPQCGHCIETLKNCHDGITAMFWSVRGAFPQVHISDGYRDQAQQEDCVDRHCSKEIYPHSQHNKTAADGSPCSRASDLFREDEQGNPYWENDLYKEISDYLKAHGFPIKWGGEFTHPDHPHFELLPTVPQP